MHRQRTKRIGRVWAPLFLALGLCGLPPAWAGRADLDADGRAEALPPRTLAADLDRDGILEFIRHDGRVLTVSRSLDAKGAARVELPEAIRGVGGRDLDGDGQLDLAVSLASGRTVRVGRAGRPAAVGPAQDKATITFNPTWSSGTDLALTWDTALGSFDGDSRPDIVATRYGQLYLYENNADNSFHLVYTTPTTPAGSFVSVAGGDTDGDGEPELVGSETSSMPRIRLYERVADNSFVERSIGIAETPSPSQLIDRVRVADADADGRKEIIFTLSAASGSEIFVYEHSGTTGVNLYTKVYERLIGSSLVDFAVGDSDNDGWQEIVLAFGGGPPFLATLARLENDGDNSYVYKSVQPGNIGGHHAPVVADLDGDGENELAFGGVESAGQGGILVYEAIADDTYQLVFSQGTLGGSGLSAGIGRLACSHYPAVAVGSFLGDMGLWRYNGSSYENLLAAPLHLQGSVRSVSLGSGDRDRPTDLVAGSMGFVPVGDEGVFVFEQASCP